MKELVEFKCSEGSDFEESSKLKRCLANLNNAI